MTIGVILIFKIIDNRWDGEMGEKRSQKTILSEFIATYVENAFRTRLQAQFLLDCFETS